MILAGSIFVISFNAKKNVQNSQIKILYGVHSFLHMAPRVALFYSYGVFHMCTRYVVMVFAQT
jgi:hypothetical protein